LLPALASLIACQIGLHACTQGMRLAGPLRALQLNHGAWTVGLVLTMFALVPAVCAIPAGRLADRRGYHVPIRIAACASLAGALLAAAFSNLPALCAAAALCGAGSGIGMIAIQRTAGRLAANEADRLRVFSWIALAPALAGLFGPMLAGTLIDHAGFSVAFLILALLPALTLLIAQAVPKETGRVATPSRGQRPSAWNLLALPDFRRLLFINWLVSACWDVHGFALPILGTERGLSASALGAILGSYAVASMTVRLLIPVVAARLPRRILLGGALLLTCSVFALYPLLHSAWAMALCAAVLGIALGTVQPAILATLHQVTPHERHGEALAFRSMTVHVSMSIMPLAFGAVGAGLGAALLFWIMAAALGVGSMQAWIIQPAVEK
jgi:MFS family permease